MSALPNANLIPEATITPLLTDHFLELEYGHLNPRELTKVEIVDEAKLRVVALQIAALQIITHDPSELYDWIHCQQSITGDHSYDYI
jgi:hypothetical protein